MRERGIEVPERRMLILAAGPARAGDTTRVRATAACSSSA